jgi:hypothetical protein
MGLRRRLALLPSGLRQTHRATRSRTKTHGPVTAVQLKIAAIDVEGTEQSP